MLSSRLESDIDSSYNTFISRNDAIRQQVEVNKFEINNKSKNNLRYLCVFRMQEKENVNGKEKDMKDSNKLHEVRLI